MSVSVRDKFQAAAMSVHELGDIDQAIASGVQRRNRTLALAAAASMTCVAILAAVLLGAGPGDSQPEPLKQPTPAPSPESDVRGWPTTTRNGPGTYSLDGASCGRHGGSCNYRWMHNGYGSGDIQIRIYAGSDAVISDNGGTPVTIAGLDGTYRRFSARQEDWTFDVDGTPVAINLIAARSTSRADLAEAHAVIDSIYTEPSDNDLGFRVVFTLTSNDWDSG